MKAERKYVSIRRPVGSLDRLIDRASNNARVDQLGSRLRRAYEAVVKRYERLFELGDLKARDRLMRAGQLLRFGQEMIAGHRNWQSILYFD